MTANVTIVAAALVVVGWEAAAAPPGLDAHSCPRPADATEPSYLHPNLSLPRTLLFGAAKDRLVYAIGLPTYYALPSAVALERRGSLYQVHFTQALRDSDDRMLARARKGVLPAASATVRIDEVTARLIVQVWAGMLARPRRREPSEEVLLRPDGSRLIIRHDGDARRYLFAIPGEVPALAGGPEGSLLHDFVALIEALGALPSAVPAAQAAELTRLRARAEALLARLGRNESCVGD